ncbi:MAG: arylsulfatase [Spirochaetales bacterium]|nr:arylsulfatase [Spirochaetales bacterium]
MNKPNVILVLTDDQGYGDLGCHGNPVIQTPEIDAFYRESLRFTNFHVGPTCAPSRSMLMTGHHANSTGVWHTIGGRSLLRRNEWSLASAFREAGYDTSLFGKWHLGDNYPYRPQDRGFNKVVMHGGGGISQVSDWWGNDYFDDTYLEDGIPRKFEGYCTDVWFGEALRHIKKVKDNPFLCCITVNAPHEPYNVDNRYADPYRYSVPEDRARFYGMISNIDENFGFLRRKLDELDLTDNTILIFMTDNGSSCGCTLDENQFVSEGFNAGMRGRKCSEYEGGHRVPFFMNWPAGVIDKGRDEDVLASAVDFMPTLLDLCGIDIPVGRGFHGSSLKPVIRGDGSGFSERFLVTDSQRITHPEKWRLSSVMSRRWRLINGRELYDIQRDTEQRNDLSDEYPDIVETHRQAYEEWWALVSTRFGETIPIDILKDTPVKLCCHDWRNEESHAPYQQNHIREGLISNGYWEIDVLFKGLYRFDLYRWPRESSIRIRSGIDGDDVEFRRDAIDKKEWKYYTGGHSLPVSTARIRIGSYDQTVSVSSDDLAASFILDLPAGETVVQTWFYTESDDSYQYKRLSDEESRKFVRGAYYVYVTSVD